MAHFAELSPIYFEVLRVFVVNNEDLLDENGNESEEKGIEYCKRILDQDKIFKQTSYNAKFRGKYAGIGDFYDKEYDVFLGPKPFQSWTFSEKEKTWVAPVEKPEVPEEGICDWDEGSRNWIVYENISMFLKNNKK